MKNSYHQQGQSCNRSQIVDRLKQLDFDQLTEWMFFKKQKANSLFKSKQYQSAIQVYKQSLVPFIQNLSQMSKELALQIYCPVLLNLATCFYSLKQYDIALDYTDKVLQQRGDHAETYFKKANILLKLDRQNEAKQVFMLSSKYTNDPVLLKLIGIQLVKLGNQENFSQQSRLVNENIEEQRVLIYRQSGVLNRIYCCFRQICVRINIGKQLSKLKSYMTLFNDND